MSQTGSTQALSEGGEALTISSYKLYDYQEAAVERAFGKEGFLIADEMG